MSNEILKIKAVKVPGFKFELSVNVKGKPVVKFSQLMSSGKNKGLYKFLNGYYFHSEDERRLWIESKLESLAKERNRKAELVAKNKAAREGMVNPYKVGQLLYESWGWEQTNIDFYEVVEVKAKSVIVRPISGEMVPEQPKGYSSMSAMVRPIAGSFNGEAFLKPVKFYINQVGELNFFLPGVHRGHLNNYDKAENGVYSSWYA